MFVIYLFHQNAGYMSVEVISFLFSFVLQPKDRPGPYKIFNQYLYMHTFKASGTVLDAEGKAIP